MERIIVNESAKEIRAIARTALRGNWGIVTLGYVVYYLLTDVVSDILSGIFSSAAYQIHIPQYIDEVYNYSRFDTSVSFVGNLYYIVVSGALMVGLCSFLIAFFRRRDINPAYVFNGFEYFIKTLGLFLYYSLFVFLWTLLFIVPGIIAAFRYSQAFYIMADNPEKSITQCINESKIMMDRNKGRLFYLDLTFIGWMILASIPSGFISNLVSPGTIIGYILNLVLSIPVFIVYAYMHTSEVAFYELASGHLVARPSQPDAQAAYEPGTDN